MLASIHPLGERGRNHRWGVTVAFYVVGSAAGGALTGLAAGGLGAGLGALVPLSARAIGWLATALLAAALVLDWRVDLPSWRRQVDESWLQRFRGWVYGLGFGFQLGLGVVTIVSSAALYAVVALSLLTRSPRHGLVIGLTFGLARGLTILAAGSITEPGHLRRFHRRMAAAAPRWRWATRAGLALSSVLMAIL